MMPKLRYAESSLGTNVKLNCIRKHASEFRCPDRRSFDWVDHTVVATMNMAESDKAHSYADRRSENGIVAMSQSIMGGF